jgi:hypothetical protein
MHTAIIGTVKGEAEETGKRRVRYFGECDGCGERHRGKREGDIHAWAIAHLRACVDGVNVDIFMQSVGA